VAELVLLLIDPVADSDAAEEDPEGAKDDKDGVEGA